MVAVEHDWYAPSPRRAENRLAAPTMMFPFRRRRAALGRKPASPTCSLALCALALLPAMLAAQPLPAGESRIARVTLYPGSALVERVMRVAAGQRQIELPCLPANLDVNTLRVDADAGIELGAAVTRSRTREQVAACRADADETQIRDLQAQVAQLDAEHASHELVLGYLRALGGRSGDAASAPLQPAALATLTEAMRRNGLDALQAQSRLAARKAVIERELRQRTEARDRLNPPTGPVLSLSLPVRAAREGELRVRYLVTGPTWGPRYRARLDPERASIEFERLAQVRQTSGEDWTGVELTLSTGRPRDAVEPRPPSGWKVGIASAPEPAERQPLAMGSPRPVAPGAPPMPAAPAAPAVLDFEPVRVQQGEFATEFVVPGRSDVASRTENLLLRLDSRQLPAALRWRVNPQVDAAAYLVAVTELPEGIWPGGPVVLSRGAQGVGNTWLKPGPGTRLELPFGRDEQVRVRAEAEQRKSGSGGFVGNRSELRIEHVYEIENLRRGPVRLQVFESSPASTDERVEVTRRFVPEPGTPPFEAAGVVAWELDLAAGARQRFSAEYRVSHPKDLRLTEQR